MVEVGRIQVVHGGFLAHIPGTKNVIGVKTSVHVACLECAMHTMHGASMGQTWV